MTPRMSAAEIDVVVVDYHTPRDLAKFVESTKLLTCQYNLAVVEVEVPAPTVGLLNRSGLPRQDARSLSSPENIGYARACNWGAAEGDSPAIGFFNADVELTPGAIEHCLEVLWSADDIAVVGPRQVDGRGRITHAGIYGRNSNAHPRAFHQRDKGQFVEVEDMVSVAGSAYIVKRDAWDEMTACPDYRRVDAGSMGGFLRTPHYYEETWFSYHVRHHGWRVVYDGAVTIRHEWHQASPLGGHADQRMKESRRMFRAACDAHGIEHD